MKMNTARLRENWSLSFSGDVMCQLRKQISCCTNFKVDQDIVTLTLAEEVESNSRYKSFIFKKWFTHWPDGHSFTLLPLVAVATVSYLQKSISLSASVWFILDFNSNPIGPGLRCQGCRSGNRQAFEISIKLVLSCTVDFYLIEDEIHNRLMCWFAPLNDTKLVLVKSICLLFCLFLLYDEKKTPQCTFF